MAISFWAMAVRSITSTVNSDFLAKVTSSQKGSAALAVTSDDFPDSVTAISDGLRIGARRLADSIARVNSSIAVLNITREDLTNLGKITTKVVEIAKRAERASTSSEQRRALDTEFQKLGRQFTKIVDDSSAEDLDVLTKNGLSEALKISGLDEESAGAVADFYKKFKTIEGKSNFADENIKGRRPIRIPTEEEVTIQSGSGGFNPPTLITSGLTDAIVSGSGDFDEDGDLDVITPSATANLLYYFESNGDGTFATAVSLGGYSTPVAVDSGDFNNDGDLDIVVGHYTSNYASVSLGNGDGSFAAAISLPFGTTSAGRSVLADFDEDGNLDIATTSQAFGAARIYLGNGDGTFDGSNAAIYGDPSNQTIGIAAGDFDLDGHIDLAMSDAQTTSIKILTGDGTGNFVHTASPVFTSVGTLPTSYTVETADLNADSKLDLVVSAHNSNAISLLFGNGDGSFQSAVTYSTGGSNIDAKLGDYDNDGDVDIFVARDSATSTLIFNNNGLGTFSSGGTIPFGSSDYAYLRIEDYNGDGALDVLGTGQGGELSIALNDPIIETTSTVAAGRTRENLALFSGGRTVSNRAAARAVRVDAEALADQIKKNIKAVDTALEQIDDTAGLIRATGLGLLEVGNTLRSPASAESLAGQVRRQIRAQDRRFTSFLDPVVAATLLAEDS